MDLCQERKLPMPCLPLRMLIKKCKEGQREQHCVFVDLQKAYDMVPRERVLGINWNLNTDCFLYCIRKSQMVEK